MDFSVIAKGERVGCCTVLDCGLYWSILCRFEFDSLQPVRVFFGGMSLGLPLRSEGQWMLEKMLSKSSGPDFFAGTGTVRVLSAAPEQCSVYGHELLGYYDRKDLQRLFRIPADLLQSHPCMALFCFFSYEDGFWTLKLNERGEPVF